MAHESEGVGWYVHLGRLSAATDGAVETAGGLRKKTGEVQPGCVAAAGGHEEMGFATALTSCHGRFSDHFHGHADAIHGIGVNLSTSHTHYTLAEAHSDEAARSSASGV